MSEYVAQRGNEFSMECSMTLLQGYEIITCFVKNLRGLSRVLPDLSHNVAIHVAELQIRDQLST